jgi:hypothetical protein
MTSLWRLGGCAIFICDHDSLDSLALILERVSQRVGLYCACVAVHRRHLPPAWIAQLPPTIQAYGYQFCSLLSERLREGMHVVAFGLRR